MSARSERMSPVDRAWLLMERRTNPMMVVALGIVQRRLSLHSLKHIVRTRFLSYRRFQCRPVDDYLGASWKHDDAFDLDAHVHRVALDRPAAQAELEELAGELASTPLPNDRPMWSFHLVERYRGGSAFIIRIHHSYADGMALVKVMFGLTDEGAAAEPDAALPFPADKASRRWARCMSPSVT
jgi:diacylglycerol O-acyltransferase / wax synthase